MKILQKKLMAPRSRPAAALRLACSPLALRPRLAAVALRRLGLMAAEGCAFHSAARLAAELNRLARRGRLCRCDCHAVIGQQIKSIFF